MHHLGAVLTVLGYVVAFIEQTFGFKHCVDHRQLLDQVLNAELRHWVFHSLWLVRLLVSFELVRDVVLSWGLRINVGVVQWVVAGVVNHVELLLEGFIVKLEVPV